MTKEKEFNLSEKVRYCYRICRTKNTRSGSMQKIIKAEDVKEFIKEVEKRKFKVLWNSPNEYKEVVEIKDLWELAGGKLI